MADAADAPTTDESLASWPPPFSVEQIGCPNLEFDDDSIEKWVYATKTILVRALTWNLAGQPPPKDDDHALSKSLLPNKYHLYVIGTEECERSIAQSAVNPSKKEWEGYLIKFLGGRYVPLRSHTLQATHIMVFAHQGIAHLCHNMSSTCVACGIGNTLGNKGGVSIRLEIGRTSILFVNSHLAAHQNAVAQRNQDVYTISKGILLNYGIALPTDNSSAIARDPPPAGSPRSGDVINSNKDVITSTANMSSHLPESKEGNISYPSTIGIENQTPIPPAMPVASVTAATATVATKATPRNILESCADRIIFMGDMNYRILGTRPLVDTLLKHNMHEVMTKNDQLNLTKQQGLVFQNFSEPPLNFRPTYKLDVGSNQYDSSSKQRIPAWTDRILHSNDGVKCTLYDADFTLQTSDHRPVFAAFEITVEFDERHIAEASVRKDANLSGHEFQSKSQVCTIS